MWCVYVIPSRSSSVRVVYRWNTPAYGRVLSRYTPLHNDRSFAIPPRLVPLPRSDVEALIALMTHTPEEPETRADVGRVR